METNGWNRINLESDGPLEDEIQIYRNEVDPPWRKAIMGPKRWKLSKSLKNLLKIFEERVIEMMLYSLKWENFSVMRLSVFIFSYLCIKTWQSVNYKNDFTATFTFDEGYFHTLYVVQAQSCFLWFELVSFYINSIFDKYHGRLSDLLIFGKVLSNCTCLEQEQ